MKRPFAAALTALGLAMAAPVLAQDYPNGTIMIVDPYTPGGAGDIVARTIAPHLEKELGTSVTVENKVGGAGVVGVSAVLEAPADGQTLLMGFVSQFTQLPQLRDTPYAMDDFIPVYHIAYAPVTFYGRADLPFDDVAGLVAYAKEHPGEVRFGTSGSQSASDIDAQLLEQLAGIELMIVPYQGVAAAVTGLLGNEIDIYASTPSAAIQHVETGTLKFLGSPSPERFEYLPDTPTLREQGYDIIDQWAGAIFVRKDTPPEIVAKLEEAIAKVVQLPEVRETLKVNTIGEKYLGSEEAKVDLQERQAFWTEKLGSIGMLK